MLRLLVADDHQIVREGVLRVLTGCSDMRVVADVESGDRALAICGEMPIDVAILDISMPGMPFQDLIRRILAIQPQVKILMLSVHVDKHYMVGALRAGATGYLPKDRSSDELPQAIRVVATGQQYLTESIDPLVDLPEMRSNGNASYGDLSIREREVLIMLGRGMQQSAIAAELGLSVKTVNTYRARMFEKMAFRNNADLIRYTLQHGLVD